MKKRYEKIKLSREFVSRRLLPENNILQPLFQTGHHSSAYPERKFCLASSSQSPALKMLVFPVPVSRALAAMPLQDPRQSLLQDPHLHRRSFSRAGWHSCQPSPCTQDRKSDHHVFECTCPSGQTQAGFLQGSSDASGEQ